MFHFHGQSQEDIIIRHNGVPTRNSTSTHHAPGFWHSLKRVFLTRRALQELDRRDALEARTVNFPNLVLAEHTRELKRFARIGGPDLSDIIQYPQPGSTAVTSVSPSDLTVAISGMSPPKRDAVLSTSQTSASTRSSAYDANFMTLLIERNIEPSRRANKPANFEHLLTRLKQPRPSLAISEEQFDFFMDAMENAVDESMVMSDVFPMIRGDHIYPSTQNRPCRNWKPLIDADLVIPQPDFFDGVRKATKYGEIHQVLDKIIVPSTTHDCPYLPNFFGEVKAPKGSGDVAERQACYDGAFGARAMHYIQSFCTEETYDHNAYTFTFTYYHGVLEIFAHHLSQPYGPNTPPHYHMTSLDVCVLRKSRQAYTEGTTAFRNLRDLASDVREHFLVEADQRMQGIPEEEAREKLIAEAMHRVHQALPDLSSFEDAVRKALSHSTNGKSSRTLSDEDGSDGSDVTIKIKETPIGRGAKRNQKSKVTSRIRKSTWKAKHKTEPRAKPKVRVYQAK